MREWNNPHSPFNSMKVLYHADHLKACYERKLLPPIQADTNPTNVCDYNCVWCNSKEFRQRENKSLSKEHLFKLAYLYNAWGVKSTCIAGGGEPLLNESTYDFVVKCREMKIETGMITNGFHMKNFELLGENLKWCGFSIDAGTAETYSALKGVSPDHFDVVMAKMERLASIGKARVCAKFLIHPTNQGTILEFVKRSRDAGVSEVHIRPVGMMNLYRGWVNQQPEFNLDVINDQLRQAFELEEPGFHVYGIRHKFGQDFKFKNTFKKCYCSPLLATFCADGWCYLCFDRRGGERMCEHFQIREFWGSPKHIEMLEAIDPKTCPRCTYSTHNEIIENLFVNDNYTINFP